MVDNPDMDPYVCFRRREIKSTRKARRGDVMSLDKLRKLKEDLCKTKELLEIVHKREILREESLIAGRFVFEKRVYVRRLKKILGINTPDFEATPEKPRKRIKRIPKEEDSVGHEATTKSRIPAARLREAANLVAEADLECIMNSIAEAEINAIEEKAAKAKLEDEKNGFVDYTEVYLLLNNMQCPILPSEKKCGYWFDGLCSGSNLLSKISESPDHNLSQILSRRRIGRGGRVIFDRHVNIKRISSEEERVGFVLNGCKFEDGDCAPDDCHFVNSKSYCILLIADFLSSDVSIQLQMSNKRMKRQ